MKKTLVKGIALAFVGSLFVAGSAMATPKIYFTGYYELSDQSGDSGISETIDFLTMATVGASTESTSEIIGDAAVEYIDLATLTLDESNLYNFNPTIYDSGFKLYDDDGTTLLMTADVTFEELVINAGSGLINPALSLNLSDINLISYLYGGGSSFIDGLIDAAAMNVDGLGGEVDLTLNLGQLFVDAINSGDTYTASYSGSASVPEPTTMLLMGTGLAGLAGVSRKRKKA